MARIVNFYEVSLEEKSCIAKSYTSTTSKLQVPDFPKWKDPEWQKEFYPMVPPGPFVTEYDQFMNRTAFIIHANRGKIRCAVYVKPCNVVTGDRSIFKKYIVLTNESKTDFYVDKYTELGLLMFGYDGFTCLSASIGKSVI
jgi:hypothetical protein